MQLVALPLLLALMYFFLVRPQQVRVKRQRALISSLEVGDRVLTVGGMVGTVVSLEGDLAELEIADGVVATFVRPAISRRVDPDLDLVDDDADGHDASGSQTPEVDA